MDGLKPNHKLDPIRVGKWFPLNRPIKKRKKHISYISRDYVKMH